MDEAPPEGVHNALVSPVPTADDVRAFLGTARVGTLAANYPCDVCGHATRVTFTPSRPKDSSVWLLAIQDWWMQGRALSVKLIYLDLGI